MKCKICEKDYDEEVHIPKNLTCGHTFCDVCLKKYQKNEEIECPRCTKKSSSKLPICYAVLDIISSDSQQNRIEFCSAHPLEKIEFHCQNDNQKICSLCILTLHNGHLVLTLKEPSIVNEIKKDIEKEMINIEGKISLFDKFRDEINKSEIFIEEMYKEQMRKLQLYDSQFLKRKKEKMADFKELIANKYRGHADIIEKFINRINDKADFLEKHNDSIDKLLISFEGGQATKTSEFNLIRTENNFRKFKLELDEFKIPEEKINEYYINYNPIEQTEEKLMNIPKVFNESNKENFNSIILIGDSKDKLILNYQIESDSWSKIEHRNFQIFDFYDYCSTSRFDNGDLLITGGCIYSNFRHTAQKSVYRAKLENGIMSFSPFKNMNISRFSHGLLIIKDTPYVFGKILLYCLGGHDGNETLSSLECYNSQEKKWILMNFMNIEREIFAYCSVKDRYIYAFGGFNLNHLDSIERYDTLYDKWKLLNVKMKKPLQNASAVTLSNDRIMLVGGYNGALHRCVDILDLNTCAWISVEYMRVPRRKAHPFKYNNKIFIFGGESAEVEVHTPEVYDLINKSWSKAKSYDSIVNKSLNFWSSSTILI